MLRIRLDVFSGMNCIIFLFLNVSIGLMFVYHSVFNKTWQAKLETKRAAEMEAEKAVKIKANDEMGTWMTQRDIRLRAKKVLYFYESMIKSERHLSYHFFRFFDWLFVRLQ